MKIQGWPLIIPRTIFLESFTSWHSERNTEIRGFFATVCEQLKITQDSTFNSTGQGLWLPFSLLSPVPDTDFAVVVQLLSHVWLCVTPVTAGLQASLPSTISWSLLTLMSIESAMPSNHLILCRPLLLLPSIFPSIRVFSSELALGIRRPKYWSFGFS